MGAGARAPHSPTCILFAACLRPVLLLTLGRGPLGRHGTSLIVSPPLPLPRFRSTRVLRVQPCSALDSFRCLRMGPGPAMPAAVRAMEMMMMIDREEDCIFRECFRVARRQGVVLRARKCVKIRMPSRCSMRRQHASSRAVCHGRPATAQCKRPRLTSRVLPRGLRTCTCACMHAALVSWWAWAWEQGGAERACCRGQAASLQAQLSCGAAWQDGRCVNGRACPAPPTSTRQLRVLCSTTHTHTTHTRPTVPNAFASECGVCRRPHAQWAPALPSWRLTGQQVVLECLAVASIGLPVLFPPFASSLITCHCMHAGPGPPASPPSPPPLP